MTLNQTVLLFLLMTPACGAPPDLDAIATAESEIDRYIEVPFGGVTTESQCGATLDLQDVERYDGTAGVLPGVVSSYQGPVGLHVDVGCSGTLIAPDIFLSAGHCGYLVGDTVRFGFQVDAAGNRRMGEDFHVIEVIEQQDDGNLDYAVVRLEGNPGGRFGFARITNRAPAAGELLTIIGHPNRMPKQVSTGSLVAGAGPRGANWLRHQADTLAGSSGSGVFGADGLLVAVHTNGGCRATAPIEANEATRMTALLASSTALAAIRARFDGASLVNGGGLCLDVEAQNMRSNGARVQLWSCSDQPQQTWTWVGNALVNTAGLCLDVHAPEMMTNGGRVQVWECTGQPQQQWRIENGALVNGGGLCLDAHAPEMWMNGGRVQVWQCNQQPHQRWTVPSAPIVSRGGLCLDVNGPQIGTNGGVVQAWRCNGEPQQQWRLENGAIVDGAGLCLDVHQPEMMTNGGRVQVWQCNGQAQQRWRLQDGMIVNGGGLCLDIHAPDLRNNGARVQMWQCAGTIQQSWFVP